MKTIFLLLLTMLGCRSSAQPDPVPQPAPTMTYNFSECGEGVFLEMAPCWGYTIEVKGNRATVIVGGPQAPEPVKGRYVNNQILDPDGNILVSLTPKGCLEFGTLESPLGTKKLCPP